MASGGSGALAAAADRLVGCYGAVVAPEVIWRVLYETYDELLESSSVTTYVVVLGERSVSQRLTAVAPMGQGRRLGTPRPPKAV